MCAAANRVLPVRTASEGFANPGRLYGGVSIPGHGPGARTHGASHPHDPEMDLAWQELMAITELQEFAVPNDSPYETIQYHTMELPVSPGGFGLSQAHPHTAPDPCGGETNPAAAYEGSYSEVLPACQRQATQLAGSPYGQPGPQLTSRFLNPPLMNILEHTSVMGGCGDGLIGKDNPGLSHGLSRHMQTIGHPPRMDDLESDSGLSLGSSPPLASPEDAMSGVPAYSSTEVGLTYSDGEIERIGEHGRKSNPRYSMEYRQDYRQHPAHNYSGSCHFPASQPCQIQPHFIPSMSMKYQQCLPSALNDLHRNGSASRGSISQAFYVKPRSNTPPVSLSRDERRAHALKIPFPLEKIINLPVDDFNELLTQYTLTDTQLALVRDIRRRGKNKVAAQNCRKRKLENIVYLEGELGQLQAQRDHLARERMEFQRNLAIVKHRLTDLYGEVFSQLRDENGHPYSTDDYALQQTPDGNVYLVPLSDTMDGE